MILKFLRTLLLYLYYHLECMRRMFLEPFCCALYFSQNNTDGVVKIEEIKMHQ